jgi:hypothetical protein
MLFRFTFQAEEATELLNSSCSNLKIVTIFTMNISFEYPGS